MNDTIRQFLILIGAAFLIGSIFYVNQKYRIRDWNFKIKITLLTIQSGILLHFLNDKRNIFIQILLFITSFLYCLTCYEKRARVYCVSKHSSMNFLSFILDIVNVLISIFIKWGEKYLMLISSLMLYAGIIGRLDFDDLVDSFILFFSILFLFICALEMFSALSGTSVKFVLLIPIIVALIGMFDSKWWTGIGLLTTILGSAITKEFLEINTNFETESFDETLFKFIIPYTTLLGYVSLIFVKEIIPTNWIILFINQISDSDLNLNNVSDKIIMAGYIGILEIFVFIILWIILKHILITHFFTTEKFKTNLDNIQFFIEQHLKNFISKI